ncbi:MAG TPA: flagellar export protein FliJ [Candidatus Babeliales bacterium]|nr:flagellar export protein FliJ [Candidatus Babeliales bacterium]
MPVAFRFSLEALLVRRKHLEEAKQRDFAAARRALDEERSTIEALAAARLQNMRELAGGAGGARCPDLRLRDLHLLHLDAVISAGLERSSRLEAACRQARDALLYVHRERRAVEKLKERRRRAHQAKELRREELQLDETNARNNERAARDRLVRAKAGKAQA